MASIGIGSLVSRLKTVVSPTESSKISHSEDDESIVADTDGDDSVYEKFKPSLAEQSKAGFFYKDVATQTEVSEIVELKEMTVIVQNLIEELDTLKREFRLTRHNMLADYENKLEQRSIELYCRINDKVEELEKMHKQRVEMVRHSCRQQLSNAIKQIAIDHSDFFEEQIEAEADKYKLAVKELEEQIQELLEDANNSNDIMKALQNDVEEAREDAKRNQKLYESVMNAPPPPEPNTAEIEELNQTIINLDEKIDEMQQELDNRRRDKNRLILERDDIKKAFNKKQDEVRKLEKQIKTIRNANEKERDKILETINEERQQYEKEAQRQMDRLKREMEEKMNKEKSVLQAREREMFNSAVTQKKSAERQQIMERIQRSPVSADDRLTIKRLEGLVQRQREQIARLEKDLQRLNKTWEKKIIIMQQTMLSLKNESFLRTSLRRQAATLHQATVAYMVESPTATDYQKKALPNIRQDEVNQAQSTAGADWQTNEPKGTGSKTGPEYLDEEYPILELEPRHSPTEGESISNADDVMSTKFNRPSASVEVTS